MKYFKEYKVLQKKSALLNGYCNSRQTIAAAIDLANSLHWRPLVQGSITGVGTELAFV